MGTVRDIAKRLASPGKGILASDESPATMGKRLVKAGVENTPENRRQYRSLFYGANIGEAISGAIVHPECLDMSLDDGRTFPAALMEQGVLVGVKVDTGLEPLDGGWEGETQTKGLDDLGERLMEYKEKGASFAKWRAAIRIVKDKGVSQRAMETNARQLAEYAAVCQTHGIMPIVEPEILIDGDHSIDAFEQATRGMLAECVYQLQRRGVDLEGILLKPQMIVPGVDCQHTPAPSEIAKRTLRVLRATVPPAVPGIMFLSGGQTEYQSTRNLNMLNVVRHALEQFSVPFRLSFSFGRGLQASVLDMWSKGMPREECMRKAEEIARVNGLATWGAFFEETEGHPTLLARGGNLQETFRGMY